MNEEQKKRALVWVGVIVVLVGVVLALTWVPGAKQGGQAGPTGPTPVYAPKGELAPQFPKELILDESANIASSYSINYSSSTNQYTAQWTSTESADTLVSKYKSYFSANGWTVAMNKTASKALSGISAARPTGYALVTILAQAKGAQVTVTYVAH